MSYLALKSTMAFSILPTRNRVLATYKKLLRLSQTWEAKVPKETIVEQNYIRQETKKLFRENMLISDSTEIMERLREADARYISVPLIIKSHYLSSFVHKSLLFLDWQWLSTIEILIPVLSTFRQVHTLEKKVKNWEKPLKRRTIWPNQSTSGP